MLNKMSKGFYIGGYIGGLLGSLLLLLVAVIVLASYIFHHPNDDPPNVLFGLIFLSLAPILFSGVVVCIFVYRMWAAIQDNSVRTTPARAVGLLLVPFFNLYWMFHVFRGFAWDYNEYVARRQLGLPRLDEQPFRWYPISVLCSLIPFVGGIALLISVPLLAVVMIKTCDAVNALSTVQQTPSPAPLR